MISGLIFLISANNMNKTLKNKKGFAILFAVLTASLLLMVGLSIFNISIKELTITSFNTESKKAIYASQSGIECALYWMSKGGDMFSTTTNSFNYSNGSSDCGAGILNETDKSYSGSGYEADFWFGLTPLNEGGVDISGPCAHLIITGGQSKQTDDGGDLVTDPDTGAQLYDYNFEVNSYGYNTCDILNNGRLVEKVFNLTLNRS